MDRAGVRSESVHAIKGRGRENRGRRTVDANVPGHGEYLQIYRGDGSAFLICDEGITREASRSSMWGAACERSEAARDPAESKCAPRDHSH